MANGISDGNTLLRQRVLDLKESFQDPRDVRGREAQNTLLNERAGQVSRENVSPFTGELGSLTPGDPFGIEDIPDTIYQATAGVIQGFTTLDPLDNPPENRVERFARSIGNIAGFFGFIPGAGPLGRVASSLIFQSARRGAAALRAAGGVEAARRGLRFFQAGKTAADTARTFRSIPLQVADLITKQAGGVAKTLAGGKSLNFLGSRLAKDVIQSGFHIGTAGAVSAWTDGTQAMMDAFLHTAALGGGGRIISNIPVEQALGRGAGRTIFRAASSALFEGAFSSQVRDAPTDIAIFDALTGAFFGAIDRPLFEQEARQKVNEVFSKHGRARGSRMLMRVEQGEVPGFEDMSPRAQAELRAISDNLFGRVLPNSLIPEAQAVFAQARTTAEAEQLARDRGLNEDTINRIRVARNVEEQLNVLEERGMSRDDAIDKIKGELGKSIDPSEAGPDPVQGFDVPERRAIEGQYSADKDLGDKYDILTDPREVLQVSEISAPLTRFAKFVGQETGAEATEFPTIKNNLQEFVQESVEIDRTTTRGEFDDDAFLQSLEEDPETLIGPQRRERIQEGVAQGEVGLRAEDAFEQLTELPGIGEETARQIIDRRDELETTITEDDTEGGWENFQKRVEEQFDINLDEFQTQRQNLRRFYKRATQTKQRKQLVIDNTQQQVIPRGRIDPEGKQINRFEAPTHDEIMFDRHAGVNTYSLTHVRTITDKGVVQDVDLLRSDAPDYSLIYDRLDRDNKAVLGGVKDKTRLKVADYVEPNAEDIASYTGDVRRSPLLNELVDRLDAVAEEEGFDQLPSEVKARQKERFGNWIRSFPHGERLSDARIEEIYDRAWYNNMQLLQARNGGLDLETMMRNQDQFITDPVAFNKRMQLTDRGAATADAEFYPSRTQQSGGLQGTIVRDTPRFRESLIEGEDDITIKTFDEDGNRTEVPAEQVTDGAIFLRQDVFDSMVEDGGWPRGTGLLKGSMVTANEGEGMLMGKFAYHRAPDNVNQQMARFDHDYMMFESAAKQTGQRSVYDIELGQDGVLRFFDENGVVNEPDAHLVPWEGVRLNMGVGEDPQKALEDTHVPKQLFSNLNRQQTERLDDGRYIDDLVVDEYLEPSIKGDDRHNKKAWQFLSNRNEGVLEGLDVDKLGLDVIMRVLYPTDGVIEDHALYRRIRDHIHERKSQEPEFWGEEMLDPTELVDKLRGAGELNTAADAIMTLFEGPIKYHHSFSAPYAEAALRNYITNRAVRPVIDYSGKAFMKPYDPLKRQALPDLEQGKFYLDEAWKDKTVRARHSRNGEEVKLGELWNDFQEAEGRRKEQIRKDLTFTSARVPMDSMSGARILELAGFTGDRGAGATFHPKDMEYLGGADLDGDNAFLFQDLEPELMREIERNKDEFDDEAGFTHLPKQRFRDEFVERLDNDLRPGDTPEVRQQDEDHFVSMGDPRTVRDVAEGASRGNALMGIAANYGRRAHAILDANDPGDVLSGELWAPVDRRTGELGGFAGRLIERGVLPENVDPESIEWRATLAEDAGEVFRHARRDLMGLAVDAADERGLVSKDRATETLDSKFLENGQIRYRTIDEEGNRSNVKTVDAQPRIWWVDNPNPKAQSPRGFASLLSRANNYADGRDWDNNRKYSIWQTFDGLSEFSQNVRAEDLNNPYYRGLRMLGDIKFLDPAKEPIPFVGRKFVDTFERFEEFIDPRATEEGRSAEAQRIAELVGRKRIVTSGQDPRRVNADPREKAELAVQDIWDWTSVRVIADAGQRALDAGSNVNRLQEIRETVERLKDWSNVVRRADTQRRPGESADAEQRLEEIPVNNMEDINRRFTDLVNRLPDELAKYAETYMMGSLFQQDISQKRFVKNAIEEAQARSEGEGRWEGWSEDVKNNIRETAKDYWWRTNMQQVGFMLDGVRGETIKEYGDAFNDIVQATRQDQISIDEVRNLLSPLKFTDNQHLAEFVDGADKMNETAKLPMSGETLDVWETLSEAGDEFSMEGQSRRSREMRALHDEMVELMHHYPHLQDNLESMFASRVGGQHQIGIGADPEGATMQDLRDFVNSFRDAHGRSFISKVQNGDTSLKRRHFLIFSERVADMMKPFDQRVIEETIPVVRGEGEFKFERVRDAYSTFGLITETNESLDRVNDSVTTTLEERHREQFAYIRGLGNEGGRIVEMAWAEIEANRGRDGVNPDFYLEKLDQVRKEFDLGDETFTVPTEEGGSVRQSGRELVNRVKEDMRRAMGLSYRDLIQFQGEDAPDAIVTDRAGNVDINSTWQRMLGIAKSGVAQTKKVSVRESPLDVSVDDMANLLMEFGLQKKVVTLEDGTETRIMDIEDPFVKKRKIREVKGDDNRFEFRPTDPIPNDQYLPHNGFKRNTVERAKRKRERELAQKGARESTLRQAEIEMKSEVAHQQTPDAGLSEGLYRLLQKDDPNVGDFDDATLYYRPGHTRSRDVEHGPTPGYDRSLDALLRYQRQLVRGKHNMLKAFINQGAIEDFRRRRPMGDDTEDWARFMQAYSRESIGFPSTFPKEWGVGNPVFTSKTNPWYVFSDQAIQDVADKISRDKFDGAPLAERRELLTRRLKSLSQMEGKAEMMTLLSRVKTLVNNLTGGSINTAINSGLRPFAKSFDMGFLRNHINPEWKDKADVKRAVQELGGVENFVVNELRLQGRFGADQALKEDMKDVFRRVKREDGPFSPRLLPEMRDMLKQRGALRSLTDLASMPMRVSERELRSRAWMAHYIKGREVLMANGANFEFDHPWLVKMANKGVKCVPKDTEILTTEGWKTYDEVSVGDKIYSVIEDGTLVKDSIEELNIYHEPQPVIEFSSPSEQGKFNMVLTSGHRCVIQSQHSKKEGYSNYRFQRADNLATRHMIPRRPSQVSDIGEEILNDDEVCLLAWIVSEGSFLDHENVYDADNRRQQYKVTIHQSREANPEYCDEIDGLFDRLCQGSTHTSNGCQTWNLTGHGRQLAIEYVENKRITRGLMADLTTRQMHLFLHTFIKGDGKDYHGDDDKWVIGQKDRTTLKRLQAMATISGYTTTLRDERSDGASRLYVTTHSKRSSAGYLNKEQRIEENGVWCPTTGTGRWIARRNGTTFITGNSTQFLYNNSNRPAFARTNLGRVFSRFQLFAWNSVRFRNNVVREARQQGYRIDTPEGQRLRRMLTADLFVMSMASLLPMTLFENTMAPPWDYFVDTTDWLFGSEEEQEQAFFGKLPEEVAPLNALMPPIGRLATDLPDIFRTITSGEWDAHTTYMVSTMFPFGAQLRDIGNAIDSPISAVDRLTGFPLKGLEGKRQARERLRPPEHTLPTGLTLRNAPGEAVVAGGQFGQE